jgi:tRNA(Leu) C34 or U34 (ribose-2'-O)-methylase TrmL
MSNMFPDDVQTSSTSSTSGSSLLPQTESSDIVTLLNDSNNDAKRKVAEEGEEEEHRDENLSIIHEDKRLKSKIQPPADDARNSHVAIETRRNRWMEANKDICHQLTLEDVRNVKNNLAPQWLMEHLMPYFGLKVQNPSLNQLCRERFIAEGVETVRLFLQQIGKRRENGLSHVIVLSILVKPGVFFGESCNLIQDFSNCSSHLQPKVFLADDPLVWSEIFNIKNGNGNIPWIGAMACGIPLRVDEDMLLETVSPNNPNLKILALDGISNTANMGSIIRCAAAFGIHAVVLSKDCCDPWYRRCVRVSMGYISKVPIMKLKGADMKGVIRKFRDKGIVSYAAVIDADLLLEDLNKGDVARSWCCVLGNEANGITQEVVDECSHRLKVGMTKGVDSLSVAVAAGILLHGLVEKTER